MPLSETEDTYQDPRTAIRAPCAKFPQEYHRKMSTEPDYPATLADETRLYRVAPISTDLILSSIAEHVRGLQRSF